MTDIELLPMPEGAGEWLRRYGVEKSPWAMEVVEDWFREHAHANVAHATEPLKAEIEALRKKLTEYQVAESVAFSKQRVAEARAERLAEALQKLAAHVRPTCSVLWDEAQAALRDQEVGNG